DHREFRSGLAAEQEQLDDAGRASALTVLFDRDLGVELASELGEHTGGPGVQPQPIDDAKSSPDFGHRNRDDTPGYDPSPRTLLRERGRLLDTMDEPMPAQRERCNLR